MQLVDLLKNFHQEESGQDLIEYALVLLAIAAAAVVGSASLANTMNSALVKLNSKITALIS